MSWKMQQEATESIYSKNLTNRSKYLLLLQFLCLCMIWWCMCVSVLLHLSCVDSLICMLKISAHACTQTLVTFNILVGSRQFFLQNILLFSRVVFEKCKTKLAMMMASFKVIKKGKTDRRKYINYAVNGNNICMLDIVCSWKFSSRSKQNTTQEMDTFLMIICHPSCIHTFMLNTSWKQLFPPTFHITPE